MDLYNILEVSPNASHEVVRAAYRALAKLHSKDDVRLKKLISAEEILCDAAKRKKYDDKREVVKKGKVVGEYRILEQIAEGGFGKTYKAEHITTGCFVCIKHASEVSDHDTEMLLDEARSVWDLRHWGIPAMRDIIKMPDRSLALVMSYVPGPTLAQILEMPEYNSGLDPEHVAWITERILNILKYLHLNSVVHGDVKPQNVIVQPKHHTVVLVDYGLSCVKPTSKDKTKGYTPYFAAPEQIDGKVPLPETDFYGLGMSMIFALGGDIEFIKVPGSTPSEMCGFIKRLLKREPLSRPNWEKEDLCETIQHVRKEDFGRKVSSMKPLNF
jgi:serine/threonine protein kinase